MNIVEASSIVDHIVEELFTSRNGEQAEAVFERYKIADRKERIMLLQKCMQVLGTSDVGGPLSLDDEYHDELEIFLQGRWRLLI